MVKEERAAMAIQYDYTACCTGFLQQLPSFWGISTGNRRHRSVEVPVGKGMEEGMGKENKRGSVEAPLVLAVGPDAHNMFGQEEARVC